MDPLAAPVPMGSVPVRPSGAPDGPPVVPGLESVRIQGVGVPVAKPSEATPAKGLSGLSQAEEIEKVLVPVTAAAGAVLQPESFLGKKLLTIATGFKVGEAGSAVNKLTPGATLFLLPEPLGLLPERFFMSKPQIPGTGVYIDPVYNYTRYRDRRDQRKRDEAGAAQLDALNLLLPRLTEDQLVRLRLDSDLRARAVAFVDPRVFDSVVARELDVRRSARTRAESASAQRARRNDPLYEQALIAEGVASWVTGNPDPLLSVLNVLGGSVQPESIRPVNAMALANEAAARGIRRDLVSERADP